jgi:hypothetical protein
MPDGRPYSAGRGSLSTGTAAEEDGVEQRTDDTARQPQVAAEDADAPPAEDGQAEIGPPAGQDAGEGNGHGRGGESVWSPATLPAVDASRRAAVSGLHRPTPASQARLNAPTRLRPTAYFRPVHPMAPIRPIPPTLAHQPATVTVRRARNGTFPLPARKVTTSLRRRSPGRITALPQPTAFTVPRRRPSVTCPPLRTRLR